MNKTCKCGCGTEVVKDFVRGHSSRVRKLSIEHKQKISRSNLGKTLSQETKDKMSQSKLGKKLGPLSQETRNKMSKSRLGHEVTEETRLKLKESRKNYTHSEETRKKMSESQKKAWLEGRKTYPEFLLNYSSYEVRLQPIAEKLGFVATYKDPFFIRSGSRTRIPDFVNTESKEIIEIFGTYWHRDQKLPEGQRHETPEEVIEWYGELGWKCTVVWAEEEFEEFYNELYKKSKKL